MKRLLSILLVVFALTLVATLASCNITVDTTTTNQNNAPEHIHSFLEKEVLPSCTERGYTMYTCECGNSYNDNYIDATGHDIVTHDYKASTCIEKGWEEYESCSKCDYSTYAELALADHIPGDWIIDKEATYNADGSKHKQCTVCKTTVETSIIPMLTHSYTSVVSAPTCTDRGYTTHTCTDCGNTYIDDYIPALGHEWDGEWSITVKATCGNEGTKRRDCLRCDYYETKTIPMEEHEYTEMWLFDSTYHWHAAICGHNDEIADKAMHYLYNGECIVCDYVEMIKLATPTITTVDYDTVYWNAVENATSYTVTVNDDYTYITAGLSANIANATYNNSKITKHGPVHITVKANGDGRYSDSNKSSEYSCYYVPLTESEDAKTAIKYKIGYGYNLIEDPYLDTKNYASTNSVLDINKLLTIGKYSEAIGTNGDTQGYYYSTIDDYMLKTQLDVEFGMEKGCMLIGSLKMQISANGGSNINTHKYVSTFVGETKVALNDRRIIEFEYDYLKYCLSEIFLKDVKRESTATRGMTDEQLIAYLYETYGTHAILGVNTGGTYISQYTISTNSQEIATSIQAGFSASTSGGAIDKIVNSNFNIDANLEFSSEWKNSQTETSFSTYYFGGKGTIAYNMTDYSSAQSSWTVDENNATAYGFTNDGAINLGYLIDAVDHSLAEKFDTYVEERADETYKELFGQFTKKTTLNWSVDTVGSENILKIDLSAYQQSGSMENVYSNYMLDNVMTVTPIMMGKRIDKIVISGAFDEYNENLINSFSIKLDKKWNKDITVVIDNLGVVCASAQGLVDYSEIPTVYDVGIEYSGVNVVKSTDGRIQYYTSINDSKYDYVLVLNENELLDFTTIQNINPLRLPMPNRVAGYDFVGWYDENNVAVTDNKAILLDSYTGNTGNLHLVWNACPYTVSWNDGEGYIITVKRISSPTGMGSLGELSNGAGVYYGDVLEVKYVQKDGFLITESGTTSITITDNITSDMIFASAKSLKTYYSVEFSVENNKRNRTIRDEDGEYDYINTGFNVSDLLAAGYSKANITITFDCCRISNANLSKMEAWVLNSGKKTLYHSGTMNFPTSKDWGDRRTLNLTVNLTDMLDGNLIIEWGAQGDGLDDWKLGWTSVSITVVK